MEELCRDLREKEERPEAVNLSLALASGRISKPEVIPIVSSPMADLRCYGDQAPPAGRNRYGRHPPHVGNLLGGSGLPGSVREADRAIRDASRASFPPEQRTAVIIGGIATRLWPR